MIERLVYWVLIGIALGFVLRSTEVRADVGNTWGNLGAFSYHLNRKRGYNERNWGAGLEHHYSEDVRLGLGYYRNSFYRSTTYVSASYTPWRVLGADVGAVGMFVSGYTRSPTFALVLLGYATWEGKKLGADLIVGTTAFAVRLKTKF